MIHQVTTNDNEWQWVLQRVTANDKEWPWMTTNDNRWYNEWKQMRVILGFRMKQLYNEKLQYNQQRLWKYNVLILLKLHGTAEHLQKQPPEVFYKKACSEQFCNFHRKTPEGLQLYQKRLQRKFIPMNIARFLRTPILKNIFERLLNWICF